MQSIVQLEANLAARPNSIEINQALADAYVEQGRWREAAERYRSLVALYPSTASLFVNRIRLGALALGISSVLILLAQIIQPPLFNVQPNQAEFAVSLTSEMYFFAQLMLLIAFPLLSTAVISIYKLLSYSRDHRPAFWAMVLSVIGVGLSMPTLGINAVVLPLIGRLYLDGEMGVLSVYYAMEAYPWSFLLNFGNYLLVAGITVFSWVIWRNKSFSKWAAALYLAGWILFIISNDQFSKLGVISIWILIALGGIEIARNLWTQAPVQFAPSADS